MENKSRIIIILSLIAIIIIGLIWYYQIQKNNNTLSENEPSNEDIEYSEDSNNNTNEDANDYQEYQVNEYNLVFSYPKNWNKNNIAITDVTAPLTRQELADIYEPSKTENSISASGKLLRFVMEDKSIIKSQNDWYNYIKDKIDTLINDEEMIKQTNYKFISLEKIDDINGHFVVREDYTDRENLRGRDFYVFNDDIYQFVFESNINVFDNYTSIFDKIATSLKFSE